MSSMPPLIKPRPLRPGGRVAVLAISSPSKSDRIEIGIRNLERGGVQAELASNLYTVERKYLAGVDAIRTEELNRYLRDSSFDAFVFARGGYGAMRILDAVDYEAVRKDPRPIIGYSDLTALHQAIARKAGVATFHGPMVNKDFHDGLSDEIGQWFWDLLGGTAPLTWSIEPDQVLSHGRAQGTLFGGCLSLTTALMGTPYDFWVDGGIWFWEDVDEPTYRIDRMLTHLRLSGRLQTIAGAMIGRLQDCGGSDPEGVESLLRETFSRAGIPVVFNLPFGHYGNNLMMPIGRSVEIDTHSGSFTILEPAVAPGEARR